MNEKELYRDLLSKTKEPYRKNVREKYAEGTEERKEIERRFAWEDKFIPDADENEE